MPCASKPLLNPKCFPSRFKKKIEFSQLVLLFLGLQSPIALIFTQNYNTGDYGQCYADGQIDNKDSVHE